MTIPTRPSRTHRPRWQAAPFDSTHEYHDATFTAIALRPAGCIGHSDLHDTIRCDRNSANNDGGGSAHETTRRFSSPSSIRHLEHTATSSQSSGEAADFIFLVWPSLHDTTISGTMALATPRRLKWLPVFFSGALVYKSPSAETSREIRRVFNYNRAAP